MFTYSVIYEQSDIKWSTRWDNYLYMKQQDEEIHWLSIINSSLVVIFLTGIVAQILQRTIRRDVAKYNELE